MAAVEKGRVLERKVFYDQQVIFKEGEIGDRAYLVQEGQVEIIKLTPVGEEKLIATVGKGELFGEMALVDNAPRMAMARAKDSASVVIISRDAFQEKMAKADPFIRGLLNIFVRNIRALTR